MTSVAEQLRRAREEQKLTVHQIAGLTNIKTEHIRALEEGKYDAFAAPVYIRGFVRTYANILKLDVGGVIATLDEELSQIEKFRVPPSLVVPSRGPLDFVMYWLSKLSWRVALAIGAGVLMLIGSLWSYRTWRQRPAADPLANLGPGLYQAPPNSSAELLPLPTNSSRR
ncbi:MAG: helix-turn-helix domain-containing protein [Verrucomicrobiota bacterium]